jgi:hypothetical protein
MEGEAWYNADMHHPANNNEPTRPHVCGRDCDYAPDRGCDIGDAEPGRMWWLDDAALDAEIDRELRRISAKIEFLERRDGIR